MKIAATIIIIIIIIIIILVLLLLLLFLLLLLSSLLLLFRFSFVLALLQSSCQVSTLNLRQLERIFLGISVVLFSFWVFIFR